MPTYTFRGHVVPDNAKVTINHPPQIKWDWPEGGLTFLLTPSIVDGQISVQCETEKADVPYAIGEMHMRALDIARTAVNLVAFTTGHGLSVILDTLIDPAGKVTKIVMHQSILNGACRAYALDKPAFGQILHTIFSEPQWFLALNDLIESISFPHVGPRNCARAMESIRNLVSGRSGTDERKRAWTTMNEQLNLGPTYVQFIMDHALGPRHGQDKYVPYDASEKLLHRAWLVMDRFIEWKLRGNQKLPPSDFPVLE